MIGDNPRLVGGFSSRGAPFPGLTNPNEMDWQKQEQITYLFARHARHDVMSLQSTLNMLEMAQRMSMAEGDTPLPPELQGNPMRMKVRATVRYLSSMAHDAMLLSQATNAAAYAPAAAVGVAELLEDAIRSRLKEGDPSPAGLIEGAPAGQIMALGNLLQAAVAAFYFQWTPGCHAHEAASQGRIRQSEGHVELTIPADDGGLAAAFAKRMQQDRAGAMASMIEQAAAIRTAEFVLWIARLIVQNHGGEVEVVGVESRPAYRIGLPLKARGQAS